MEGGLKRKIFWTKTNGAYIPHFLSARPARVCINPSLGPQYKLHKVYVPSYLPHKKDPHIIEKAINSDHHKSETKTIKSEQQGSGKAPIVPSEGESKKAEINYSFQHPIKIQRGTLKGLFAEKKKRSNKKERKSIASKDKNESLGYNLID